MTDTSQKLLRGALKRFETAVRAHEMKGAADPEDREPIEWEYTDAMRSLYSRLELTAPRVRKETKQKVHSSACAVHQGGVCNCAISGGARRGPHDPPRPRQDQFA